MMVGNLAQAITRQWYKKKLALWQYCLIPFAVLFQVVCYCRRVAYKKGWLTTHRCRVPVIVVGNISVGGTGKTPIVIALVHLLKQHGFNPGIVSRGYSGKSDQLTWVSADMSPGEVGDETILLAQRTDRPVVIARKRAKAISSLLQDTDCDVVISDDGLQHYAMGRDIEIALIDHGRQCGNGWYMPVGPLRESVSRLKEVDFVLENGGDADNSFQFKAHQLVNVMDKAKSKALQLFKGQAVHVIAGIGNPQRFFSYIEAQGIHVISHAFVDHHHFTEQDLMFSDDRPIIMTEKDAVKCVDIAGDNCWFMPISAILPPNFCEKLLRKVKSIV